MKNNNYKNKELLKRFLPYFIPYKGLIFFDLFCASLTTINELALPMILRYMTNLASTDIGSMTLSLIIKISFLYTFLKIIDILAYYFMNNIGHVTGAKIETDMRRDIFSHLQQLSTSFYNENKVGKLMSRITNDLFDVTEFAHHGPEEFFIGGIKLIVSFVILIQINAPLTLILFSLIPFMIVTSSKKNRIVRQMMSNQRSHIGELNSSIEDNLSGINVVKSFTNEDYEIEKFELDNLEFLDIKKGTYRGLSAFHAITRIFDALMYITIILFGGIFLINGSLEPGDLFAFVLYANVLTATIRRIVEFSEAFHRGMSGIEKFVEVMDTGIEIFDEDDAIELKNVKGDVSFNDVSFRYNVDEPYILKNLNFNISPGNKVAIVGPSGSGKTTIINLIPRFYDLDEGVITVDGVNIKNVKLQSLRENIGIVQQDVYLFNDTILENIRYGNPEANNEEIYLAAKLAGASEFIEELPLKYNTAVGERGLRLSGGQKQRISIARVFLKNPPILILDEATSALDNKSEKIVQKSLEDLSKGRTTITIAHRLSTIINSDNIIVLTDEGIEETGTHKELMKKQGMYYNLYVQGFKSFDNPMEFKKAME
ncbi:MAG: ABC transporter ATP-binding protein [Tissierellia bacterium]|nr:ABC transporter ATP-binding protein [Tissierellia bacterium]